MIIIHLLSLSFVLFTIVRADLYGMSWVRGSKKTLDVKVLNKLHIDMWAGLILMIITGLILFYPMREYLLTRPQFYVKMAFVVTLICNGFVIGKLQHISTTRSFSSLTIKEKAPLFISGAVSTICWISAIVTAFFLIPD